MFFFYRYSTYIASSISYNLDTYSVFFIRNIYSLIDRGYNFCIGQRKTEEKENHQSDIRKRIWKDEESNENEESVPVKSKRRRIIIPEDSEDSGDSFKPGIYIYMYLLFRIYNESSSTYLYFILFFLYRFSR